MNMQKNEEIKQEFDKANVSMMATIMFELVQEDDKEKKKIIKEKFKLYKKNLTTQQLKEAYDNMLKELEYEVKISVGHEQIDTKLLIDKFKKYFKNLSISQKTKQKI